MKHYKTRYGTQLVKNIKNKKKLYKKIVKKIKKIKHTTTIIIFEKHNKNNFSLFLPVNSL